MTVPMKDDIHVANTEAFIAQNPRELTLARRPRIADGSGGYTHGTPFPVGPHTCRLVGYTGQDGGATQRTDDRGNLVTIEMNLIALPDADILPGDQFLIQEGGIDKLYEVLTVGHTPPWRLEAKVYAHGR
jgi:hypothetical protein